MDPLKLLTRSSSLQKKLGAAKSTTKLHTPSETPTTNGIGETNRGKKRKRSEKASIPNPQIESAVADAASAKNGLKDNDSAAVVLPTDEDARAILKKHKLKVAILSRAKGTSGHHTILEQIATKPVEHFHDLNRRYKLSKRLAENLSNQGYTTPTEVQTVALPLLCGSDYERGITNDLRAGARPSSVDLITVAPTGSGKTLAFLVPIMNGLLASKASRDDEVASNYVKAVILAPTHELVGQIVNEGKKLALGIGLRIAALRKNVRVAQANTEDVNGFEEDDDDESQENGGHDRNSHDGEVTKVHQVVKADIVVTTPSQLLNSLKEGDDTRDLPAIEYLVLDEADVLLDRLFRDETLAVWNACTSPKLRCSLWSATIGASIEDLAQDIILDRREKLALSDAHRIIRVVVGLKDSALPTIAHKLVYGATEHGKLIALRNILQPSSGIAAQGQATLRPPFIVFTQTISRAIALHSELIYDIPVAAGGSSRLAVIHSDLSDNARSEIMARFRKGEIWVLITTDLLSRGIDFRGINGVVNYDIPTTAASYVHRAGRTGRAGREGGIAITLYTEEDIKYIRNIANVIAASEKLRKNSTGAGPGPKSQLEPWLLAALPDVSKKSRRELKTRGVESRRPVGKDGRMTAAQKKSRISTKSGYERQRENRLKDARKANRRRANTSKEDGEVENGEDVFSGFD